MIIKYYDMSISPLIKVRIEEVNRNDLGEKLPKLETLICRRFFVQYLNDFKEGGHYLGRVVEITDCGLKVKILGETGLVHNSEMPSDIWGGRSVLQLVDKSVNVKLLHRDALRGRISLQLIGFHNYLNKVE